MIDVLIILYNPHTQGFLVIVWRTSGWLLLRHHHHHHRRITALLEIREIEVAKLEEGRQREVSSLCVLPLSHPSFPTPTHPTSPKHRYVDVDARPAPEACCAGDSTALKLNESYESPLLFVYANNDRHSYDSFKQRIVQTLHARAMLFFQKDVFKLHLHRLLITLRRAYYQKN